MLSSFAVFHHFHLTQFFLYGIGVMYVSPYINRRCLSASLGTGTSTPCIVTDVSTSPFSYGCVSFLRPWSQNQIQKIRSFVNPANYRSRLQQLENQEEWVFNSVLFILIIIFYMTQPCISSKISVFLKSPYFCSGLEQKPHTFPPHTSPTLFRF